MAPHALTAERPHPAAGPDRHGQLGLLELLRLLGLTLLELLRLLLGLRRLARDLLVLRLELLRLLCLLCLLRVLELLGLLLDRRGVGGRRVEGHRVPAVMALPGGLLVHRQGQRERQLLRLGLLGVLLGAEVRRGPRRTVRARLGLQGGALGPRLVRRGRPARGERGRRHRGRV
ncbi:hypothetical protein ACWEWX_11945, partial [Streptomyces asiaticus]